MHLPDHHGHGGYYALHAPMSIGDWIQEAEWYSLVYKLFYTLHVIIF